MASKRDHYEVLGVARDADQKAIKDAFRNLALKFHPDRNDAEDAEDRFKEIAEAYAVLSDPEKRAQYDGGGATGFEGMSPEDLYAHLDLGDIFGGRDFGFGIGGGLFDSFFGRRRRPADPRRGRDIQVDLVVPMETVATGGEEEVRYGHPKTCPDCEGHRAKKGTSPRPCDACDGRGQTVSGKREGNVMFQQITTCARCRGEGTIIDDPCSTCSGTGRIFEEEHLTVKIPIGFAEGLALRIPGKGEASPQPGGEAGDLHVVVRTAPDHRFERRGTALLRSETIDVLDAALGTERTIPTLDGRVRVTIPPGTQPDSVLRLREKGLPEFGGGRRGDLLLYIGVHVPERLTPEERELYEELRTLREPHAMVERQPTETPET